MVTNGLQWITILRSINKSGDIVIYVTTPVNCWENGRFNDEGISRLAFLLWMASVFTLDLVGQVSKNLQRLMKYNPATQTYDRKRNDDEDDDDDDDGDLDDDNQKKDDGFTGKFKSSGNVLSSSLQKLEITKRPNGNERKKNLTLTNSCLDKEENQDNFLFLTEKNLKLLGNA